MGEGEGWACSTEKKFIYFLFRNNKNLSDDGTNARHQQDNLNEIA